MTELCDRVLKAGGPALLFEQPKGDFRAPSGGTIPVLGNLFGTPQRVALAMGADGDDWTREPARDRPAARVPQGAGAAEEPDGCLAEHAAGVHEGARHGAEGALERAVPGGRVGRRGRRSRATAGADLLAGRRGTADHLGPDRHARTAQEAAEPRHLSPAGDRAQQGDHALARASRRRARLPRSRARASRARRFRSRSRSARIRRRSSAR